MAWKQKFKPNVGIKAIRGWCLKYVDDAGSAPRRTPNARSAMNVELAANRVKKTMPPVGVWVVGFLDMRRGAYANYDHVFLMKYLGGGMYEIRDSETNSGARSVYRSINEILAWFGAYAPVYVGWSTTCDGRQYAEYVKPKAVVARNKTVDEIANEVIRGKWGNGPARVKALKAKGYDPKAVQNKVNQKLR